MINDYASASKDFNPIHLDEEFAEKSQFKKRIAHGMLTLSIIMEYLYKYYSEDWFKNSNFEGRFKNPVYSEEKIKIFHEENSIEGIGKNIKIQCMNESGEEVVSASFTTE